MVQPFAEHQPCSYVVEAMRGSRWAALSSKPVLGTLLWSAGTAAVIAIPLAVGIPKGQQT